MRRTVSSVAINFKPKRKIGFDAVAFYDAIRAVAERRGISMYQVGKLTHVNSATVSRMKTKDTAPDTPSLLSMCKWAGVDPRPFFKEVS